MAPTKRHRLAADDGDTEIIEIESASASLQQVSRKKQRRSNDGEESEISQQSSEDERFLEEATQYATQQKTKIRARNTPAEMGIIETVTCTNFMCHGHFEAQLGPLINFITGNNGSGKSAILTAITICLGGKATATNRGGSLKSFIKNGEEHAMLSVKLKNTSDGAYQHDVYGDSIIVERHFSRSGSSNFKIKSSAGRLISSRKGDLDDICDFFALQIDNPMNILTQDMARQFLNSSSPFEKYKFFMKGTQLEHLDGDYLIVEQNVDMIDADLYKKQQDVEEFAKSAQEAERLHRLSEKNDEIRQVIDELSAKMVWAQVQAVERVKSRLDMELQHHDEVIERNRIKAESLSEAFSQSNQACEVASATVNETKAAVTPHEDEKETVKAAHVKHKAEQIDLQSQQRMIGEEIKAADATIVRVEKAIEEEHRRLSDADGGMHAERRREIEEKRSEAQEAKARIRAHEDELPALEDNRKRANGKHVDCQSRFKEKRGGIHEAENRLNSMSRDRGKQQSPYPASLPRLLSAIQQDNDFAEKPVGPIGNHVRLLKPKWSSILEKQLGSSLDSFIVTSKRDQIRLQGHMQRIKCVSPILIGNNVQIDTTGHEPDPQFDTTLRVLEIDNDLVRKQLIIGQGIEQTILIEKRAEAVDLMNTSRPHNVKQCFAHNNAPGTGLRLGYGGGGGLSESFVPRFQGVPRMKTDVEHQISAQRDVVQNLKAELNAIEQEQKEKRASLVQCEQAIVRHTNTAKRFRLESQQAQSVVENLQDALDSDAIEEGKLDALKEQLEEAKAEKETHESSYEDSVVAKDTSYKAVKETRAQLAELDNLIKEAEAKVAKAESKAAQRVHSREVALREKNAALEILEREEQGRRTTQEQSDAKALEVEDFTSQASALHQRVPVEKGETCDKLEAKLNKLNNQLARDQNNLGGTPAEIAVRAANALETLQRAREEVEGVESLVQLLKTTLVNRRERWKKFQKHITSRARIQFFYQLSERGFRGKLLANHREKKLDLQVEPDETRKNAKGRNTQGLSGGEKSYSTICLLLSMWEAMGAPIRCLDEFDVFMDSVNRDISMEMMVRFARDSQGKQFVLITPQSMAKIGATDPDIKVVRMPDPERGGQQRLNFPIAAAS